MFVTYLSNFDSLQRTRAAYYEGARFADVFASLKRAPRRLEARIAAIPGVEVVATRVVADVTLDVPGMAEPASGRLISLPERGRPPLNDVYLRRGRWIDPARPDEVLASEMFCEAHGLEPGDRVAAIINGRRRWLTIVGVALSPEYVYAIRPGEMVPDARRFGIFWMGRRALAAAFDMEGGFNDVSLTLARGASAPDVIAKLDRLLEPYGGRGAHPAVAAGVGLDARERARRSYRRLASSCRRSSSASPPSSFMSRSRAPWRCSGHRSRPSRRWATRTASWRGTTSSGR